MSDVVSDMMLLSILFMRPHGPLGADVQIHEM